MTRRKAKLEPRKCQQCGAEYVPNTTRQMYCSKRCKVSAASKNMKSRNELFYQQARIAVAALDNDQRTWLRALLSDQRQHSDEIFLQLGDAGLIRA